MTNKIEVGDHGMDHNKRMPGTITHTQGNKKSSLTRDGSPQLYPQGTKENQDWRIQIKGFKTLLHQPL